MTSQFDHLTLTQRQQLAFIDFSLLFKGHLTQQELRAKFEMKAADGDDAFELYQEFAKDNFSYDAKVKRYFQSDLFRPLFEYDPRRTLIKLANNISDGFDSITNSDFNVEQPSHLNVPDIDVIAKLVQAMLNGNVVNIIYTSISSGSASREIVPHSIVDNGLRWHVRAYDRKTKSFRDFVLTRISKVSKHSNAVLQHETKDADSSWQAFVRLEIVPHPNNIKHSTAIEMDYGMVDGVKEIKVRAAMAGYLLRRWNVDCTDNASLNSPEYQLYLANKSELAFIDNLTIAAGFNH